jgi:hypothetical protein
VFSPDEQKAITIVSDFAPYIPRHVIEGIVLNLRDQSLRVEAEGLLGALQAMHPDIASRACREQAERARELADDLEEHLRRKPDESTP